MSSSFLQINKLPITINLLYNQTGDEWPRYYYDNYLIKKWLLQNTTPNLPKTVTFDRYSARRLLAHKLNLLPSFRSFYAVFVVLGNPEKL